MAVVCAGSGEEVDTSQLTELLAMAAGAPLDYLPVERISDYVSRLNEGSMACLVAVQDGQLGAVLLYSRFASVYPVSGSFLCLSGLYVDEIVVRPAWQRKGWSRSLLARLRDVAGDEPDIYADCDADNRVSIALLRAAGFQHIANYADPHRSSSPSARRITSLFRQPGQPVINGKER